MEKWPIAPEGLPFILGALAIAVASYLLWPKGWPLAVFFILLTLFCTWFFRNPTRVPPAGEALVVSPADGLVIYAGPEKAGRNYPVDGQRVSVFMNVFNVHVNRAPVSGKVTRVLYNPGKFLVASVDKAALENEQNGVLIETPAGRVVGYVQIAGLIARRIVCDLSQGDTVAKGQRVGLIRFGSRVDIFLPADVVIKVSKGDRVTAGESVVGVMP